MSKEENLSVVITGIKCDNPVCDFADMGVKFEDYPQWLNKPCPKCGANLLTQEDFDTTNFIMNVAKAINTVPCPDSVKSDKKAVMHLGFNGTGKVEILDIHESTEEE
jgi:predicted  nucleic acid-binding Zn-ribbon protein